MAEVCHKSEANLGDTVTILGQPGLQDKKLSKPPTPNFKDLAYIQLREQQFKTNQKLNKC